jgi:hypothetical protein
MAQPPTIYFGPDGVREHPKIFVRALIYGTSVRGRILEGMFAKLSRGDSVQTFPVWICGEEKNKLGRGVGLSVTAAGLGLNHHFLLPRDDTIYRFLPGLYRLELFCVLVGGTHRLKLRSIDLVVSEGQAARLAADKQSGLYFDWSPETARYHSHIDNARLPESSTKGLVQQALIDLASLKRENLIPDK